ncbi:UDP-2,3-diacylglucosamine diphosphatase [Teredinibacter franksiae]|uniref:UDP-2,3-diacylglucosamine diphosphatase n=1 Tax=Teredinibacter franksiae TaxID=2761453 RepID=UPI001626BD9E|nr:UDP-2,3-diacylglucosamine diphosphatase [Teredinibacter franksiae]
MADFFISDLHLKASREDLAEAFSRFVEQHLLPASRGNTLYILGDFFDAWIGDDEDEPFYLGILETLRNWTDSGLTIYFMSGNRDFLVGEAFAAKTGVTLLAEEHLIALNRQPVLLMHGDSLCTDDTEYMGFRAQVRNVTWQQTVLQVPLAQRRVMAQQLRQQSQSMNATKAEDIMDVNADAVNAVMAKHGVTCLIHGHTHRPKVHDLAVEGTEAKRYVLGDWDSHGWYICANEQGLSLHSFPIEA